MMMFNKPHLFGKELDYIKDAVMSGKISGDGAYTKRCHDFFTHKFGFRHPMLTTSCTDALEMSAILADIKPGDEVIIPSFTFVSTANAFVLRGAKVVFVDSYPHHPNIDVDALELFITDRTKAIVVVHYAGVACDMDKIMQIATEHGLLVIEDAAQAIDSYYKGRPLGSIGQLAAFSFHETKNVICGEGGMIVVNDDRLVERAEIVREKGTNRKAFFRGDVDKYGWVDVGSSFLPSDINAAYLFAQLENLEVIKERRGSIWNKYFETLQPLCQQGAFELPSVPEYATNNYHIFYLICKSETERDELLTEFKKREIMAVFHYQSLHKSSFYKDKHDGRELPNSDRYSGSLIRLPLHFDLTDEEFGRVVDVLFDFYGSRTEGKKN